MNYKESEKKRKLEVFESLKNTLKMVFADAYKELLLELVDDRNKEVPDMVAEILIHDIKEEDVSTIVVNDAEYMAVVQEAAKRAMEELRQDFILRSN